MLNYFGMNLRQFHLFPFAGPEPHRNQEPTDDLIQHNGQPSSKDAESEHLNEEGGGCDADNQNPKESRDQRENRISCPAQRTRYDQLMRLERLRDGSNPDGDSGIPNDFRIAGIEADDVLGAEEEGQAEYGTTYAADFAGA